MKSIEAFLSDLRQRNVNLWLDGNDLCYKAPPQTLTPTLRQELKERKAEILTFLHNANTATRSNLPLILPASREQDLPLSFAQQRLWFLDQLDPGCSAYNIPTAYRLIGQLNITALEQSLNEILQRHEVLRTTFPSVDGQPSQAISPSVILTLPITDLREHPETEGETEAKRFITKEAPQPFDLVTGLLFRAQLLRLAETEYVLLLNMHHIISDGWSFDIFFRELAALYTAFCASQPSPLPKLPIQYADFAHWQRNWLQGEVLESQLNYWKQQLGGNLPILQLPTDYPRPPLQTYQGAYQSLELSTILTKALKTLTQQEGVTLFMTLLAAFQTLLFRYSGQEDIIVGTPIAGRNPIETEQLIGLFVNTLPLRTNLSGHPTFRHLLSQVREVTLGAYSHQDLPLEKLIEELNPERDLNRSPLFQVMFAFQNTPSHPWELPGLTITPLEVHSGTSKFDLTLALKETPEGIKGEIEYNTDLFKPETITRMIGHFSVLLEGIVANPQQRLWDLPLLTSTEQHQLLVEWNRTQVDYPKDLCIHQLFETQVKKTPEAIAVIFDDRQLTYGELNRKANQLAHRLQQLGVKPDVLVGICVERSIEMLVGLLGILKAGGAYVPLDPTYPPERLDFMAQDAEISILLTQEDLIESLPHTTAQIICLDRDWFQISVQKSNNLTTQVCPDNLAYVIYTSGSTGQPKGVQAPHQSTVNRLVWMWNEFPFMQDEICCQKTALSFVDSVWEIFGPLLQGVSSIIVPDDIVKAPHEFLLNLNHSSVTRLVLVPSFLKVLLNKIITLNIQLNSLRYCICSGEKITLDIAKNFDAILPETQLINLYGSSEVAADVTCYQVRAEAISFDRQFFGVSIGKPIANTQAYILDSNKRLVPIGIPGELYLGGDCLARGYHNRITLTEEKFVPNLFGAGRLFRTGDSTRWLADGNIEFLGRLDHQVKIRGFRIETGEIEAALDQHALVEETVVTVQEYQPGDKHLVAYIVPTQEQVPTLEELRQFLKQKLPDYMMPATFVPLEAMPLTPNGKVDRSALPAPHSVGLTPEQTFVPPQTPVEKQLAQIWAEVLWLEREVGIHENFFDLGGHSLLSVSLVAQIEQAFDTKLPLADFFQLSTIAELAKILEGENCEPHPPTVKTLDGELESNPPLSLPDSSQPQLDPEIYHQQLAYITGWKGQRVSANSLIVGLNTTGTQPPLFWCLQGFLELSQLAKYLGEDQPTYGMRSGHLNMEYTTHNIKALAACYVSDILAVQPEDSYRIGGNCQGGLIAFEIARQLQQQGKEVKLLFLLERFIPQPYLSQVALFFGRESEFNPYKIFHEPERGWQKYYPNQVGSGLVSGTHGEFFKEPNIQDLADKLRACMEKVNSPSDPNPLPLPLPQQEDRLLPPEAYRVQLSAQQSLTASVDRPILIPVTVKNISTVTWGSTAQSGIALGNHWLNKDGEVIQWADGRVHFPQAVPSGGEIELALTVTTPLESGDYRLELDLVEEGITWFKDRGSQTATIEVNVTAIEVNVTANEPTTQASPQDARTYLTLGDTQFEKGDTERAVINYKKALAINPQQPVEVYQNLGDALHQQEQFAAAILTYQQALSLQPDNPSLYYRLGLSQSQNEEIENAIASYQKAIELNPDRFEYHQKLGDALKQIKSFDDAILAYQEVLKFQPDNPQIYSSLAQVQRQSGDKKAAISNYQTTIELNPEWVGAYFQLGNTLREQGQLDKAISAYQEVLKRQPKHPIARRHLKQLRAQASRTVIGILGMHRSGTSCLAGSLQAAGLFGGQVLEWNPDNLKGNRENPDIMNLNDDILKANGCSWERPPAKIRWLPQHAQQRDALVAEFASQARVWMFKDPRTVLMLPFWQEGITDLRWIGTFRHPLKVAMSLYERSQSRISLRHGIEMWLDYNRCLLDAFRQAPFPLLCFDLSPQEYLARLEQLLQDLKTQLGERVSLSIAAAREFYETTLVHQPDWIPWLGREHSPHNNQNTQLIATAQELYQELRQAARLPESTAPSPDVRYFLPVEETLEACQEVLTLQPDNPQVYHLLVNIQQKQGNIDRANAFYFDEYEIC